MRIDGWHVDGFGTLKDFSHDGLDRGVTVLLGENEAGKTTLLAFVRAILFGFPRVNARDERSYPPVYGGRHGGKLMLRDRDDRLWVVARYLEGTKEARVTRPDGADGGATDLADLLGHADAQLFRSVFAFGLDELQQFESLTGEGVRDRIFSVGISGAGKSAREAIAKLAVRQAELLKQSRGDAAINNLVREMLRVEGEIAAARGLAARYAMLGDEANACGVRAEQLEVQADARQRLQTEVETFIALRPQWDDLESLRLELTGLPAITDESLPDGVAGAITELAIQRDREKRLGELEATRSTAGTALADSLGRLGSGWDVARAEAVDASIASLDEVHGWARKMAEAELALSEAGRDREKAERNAALARADADRIGRELPEHEPLTVEAIDKAEVRLATLEGEAARLQTLTLTAERDDGAGAPRFWPALLLAGLAALGAVAAWFTGHAQVGVGLVIAAFLVALSVVLTRTRADSRRSGEAAEPGVIEALEASIGEAARELGLPHAPSSSDMAAVEANLRTERTRRADWNAIRGRVEDAEGRVGEQEVLVKHAADRQGAAQDWLDGLEKDWSEWLTLRRLPGVSPEGVLLVMDETKTARAAKAQLDQAAGAIKNIQKLATQWDESAAAFLRAAARPADELSRESLRSALVALDDDLKRRAHVVDKIESLERAVSVGLSASQDLEQAREELAAGDAGIWTERAKVLADGVKSLRDERKAASDAAAEAGVKMRTIEESADIPRLQEELESLRAQLADLAREYRVVSTAKALVSETLRAYVRDRQPAVLANGSQAFAAVTSGRYTRVEQDGEGALESVVVIRRDGSRLTPDQLSTGTQQQLYLSIRLALADMSAGNAESLPMIMDDCLVNFDPQRAAAVAGLLAERSAGGQCLLFTCHPETAELMARQTAGPVRIIEMTSR
jgi:uncharacterized protein YhaN